MKIALAQLNFHTGNFDGNLAKMIDAIDQAKAENAGLIVFSELAVCGYPPRDFLEFDDFILQCEASIESLASHAINIAIIVGAPSRNFSGIGKSLHNSAYVLENECVKAVVHKTLLPTYDIFDENRYFEPNTAFSTVLVNGHRLAITICEDLWNVNDNPLYRIKPMDFLTKESPEIIINIAASPFSFGHQEERNSVLTQNAILYQVPIVYVNHVGAQTELIFDGDSKIVDNQGNICDQLSLFKEEIKVIDIEKLSPAVVKTPEKIDLANDALTLGVSDYFKKLGLKKAILGLSGGIDSAVVACLAVQALGPENVLCVLLPSRYNSEASENEAIQLAKKLGCSYKTISIEQPRLVFEELLATHFEGKQSDVTEENIQSRSRAVILMALANKLGYILLNTTNKSEMAVGYGTLYGDLCGGMSVIGDLYKTEVYALARHINREKQIIPEFIITRPPSAELKDNQKDSDSLPDYAILDPLLYSYIEERKGPKQLIADGFDAALVKRVLRMVNMNEWKRYQSAPVLRLSTKSFGMGRRMPIVAKYLV